VEAAVLMILAMYFEAVLPIGPGIKSHPLFFLPRKCQCGTADNYSDDDDENVTVGEEVIAERDRVLKGADDVVIVHSLRQVYPVRWGGNK